MPEQTYTYTDDSPSTGARYLYTWLTGNLHRTYPFAEGCSAVSTDGYTLPQSLLIDMTITHRPMDATGVFFISRVDVDGNGIRLTLSFKPSSSGASPVECARTPYISRGITADTDYTALMTTHAFSLYRLDISQEALASYPGLEDIAATVIIGSCADMTTYGSFSFASTATAIEGSRVLSTVLGIQHIGFSNVSGGVETPLATLRDSFTVRAGDGIQFSHTVENGTDVITVTRTKTAEELAAVSTAAEAVAAIKGLFGQPVMRINGISPSSYTLPGSTVTYTNNIQIEGLDCTEVKAAGNGIGISNTCAKPCCGTTTPADVQTALASLSAAKDRLNSYYESLSTNIYAMQSRLASLIASRT